MKPDSFDTSPTYDARGGFELNRLSLVALLLVVALYVAARLWRLDATCLWFDELFGVHAARHTWGGMLRFVAADLIHPPLFYALLKIWVAAGGESLLWLRLLPALTSFAAIVPVLLLARGLRLGAKETTLALLLMAANGYLIKYAQEVRMYSLLLLLTLSSLWLFVEFSNAGRKTRGVLLALFAVNLLLVYTHYYGWLVVAVETLFVLFRNRSKLPSFLFGVAALLVCFAPWVYACLAAAGEGGGLAQNIGWQTRPGASDLWQLFALFHEPFHFRQSSAAPPIARWGAPLGFILITTPLVIHLLRRRQSGTASDGEREKTSADGGRESGSVSDDEQGRSVGDDVQSGSLSDGERPNATHFLLAFALAPVPLAFVLSYVLPVSVWGTRHLIVAAAPYLLLGAVALVRLRPAWLRAAALVALGCWLAFAALAGVLRREGPFIWCAWGDLVARALRDEPAGAPFDVYAFEDLVAYHLWFAAQGEAHHARPNVAVVKNVPGLFEDPAYFLPRRFAGVAVLQPSALEGERLWLAFRDNSFDEGRPPLNILKERGYRVERVFETSAQGQRAFLVLVSREGGARPAVPGSD
ncbi:MAG TPA: glycosyltransferase family 39 protein [Pyrinomonadaceae bacterium]